MKEGIPKVVAATGVLHLDLERLVEVLGHDAEHLRPQPAQLGIAGQVEVEEAVALAGVEEVPALVGALGPEEVEVDSRERLGDDDGLADSHC